MQRRARRSRESEKNQSNRAGRYLGEVERDLGGGGRDLGNAAGSTICQEMLYI